MSTYFTITGTQFQYGQDFIEPEMKVILEKEPDNEYDSESIAVKMDGLGKIGYVANSVHTVIGESFSAGRLLDRIGDQATGTVKYKIESCNFKNVSGIVCLLDE